MSCWNQSSVPGKDMKSIWRSRRSLPKKRKKNEELVEVNNELQTITGQSSMMENTIKKLEASFVDMMGKTRKEHDALYHWKNALKRKSEEKVKQLRLLKKRLDRSGQPEEFFGKGVLKICSKFTGKHPCWSKISIKLLCNFLKLYFGMGVLL